jgi:hypothetical protein
MKYGQIRKALLSKNFNVYAIQTDSVLDMVHFRNNNIEGSIDISFGHNPKEKDFPEGTELDYQNGGELLDNVKVENVIFEIDKSIAYSSIVYSNPEYSSIELNKNELKYFHVVLNIITDEYCYLNYANKYFEELTKFNKKLFNLMPIIVDNGLTNRIITASSGDETTLYRRFQIGYQTNDFKKEGVYFNFNPLTFKHDCFATMIGIDNDIEFNINISKIKFEEIIKKVINAQKEFKQLLNNKKEVLA